MGFRRLLHKRVYQIAGIGFADCLFFGVTDPTRAPSALFIVAFMLMVLSLYYLVRGFLQRRIALTIASGSAGLFALQSVGQLTTRDLAVLTPLAVLAFFYFSYNHRQYGALP